MSKINQSVAAVEARGNLRENIKRLARIRQAGGGVPRWTVWPERQLLFSLVHGMVCASQEYDPMMDQQVAWANWFLRWCDDSRMAMSYQGEDAALLLILGGEAVATAGADEDFDGGDDLTYSMGF
jgi:hypothetical protein